MFSANPKTNSDYERLYLSLDQGLHRVLEISSSSDRKKYALSVVGKRMARLFPQIARGAHGLSSPDKIELDSVLHRLRLLLRDLRRIRGYNRAVYSTIRHRLFNDLDQGNYFGLRIEIALASYFVKRGVKYTMPDPPDFNIPWESGTVQIECVSRHFSSDTKKERDMAEIRGKIREAIELKASKPYSGLSSMLFIDVTNIHSYGTDEEHLFISPTYATDLLSECQEGCGNRFGAVFLLCYMFNSELNEFSYPFVHLVDDKADPVVVDFVDRVFPRKDTTYINNRVSREV